MDGKRTFWGVWQKYTKYNKIIQKTLEGQIVARGSFASLSYGPGCHSSFWNSNILQT